jgi:hypothetical protein
MSSWILKTALQHIIGRLPKNYYWNGLFQKYVTKGYYPSSKVFEGKLNYCQQHLDYYLKFSSAPKSEFSALELGTGSWPIVPIGLYLSGASEIWTYDLVPVLQKDTLKYTLDLFLEFEENGMLKKILKSIRPERLANLRQLLDRVDTDLPSEIFEKLNIHLLIADARNTKIPDRSIDIVFSTQVLEHINAEVLTSLFSEFKSIAANDAVMIHYIGLIDQFSSFDKSITPYNFYKYSDAQWHFFNNPIISQSRLRLPDFRNLLKQTGWNLVEENNLPGSLEEIKKVKLDSKFQKYAVEDLLPLFTWLVAKPTIN